MKCYDCGTDNFEERKYCSRCGNQLLIQCSCSFNNNPDDAYCGGCGKSLSEQIIKRQNKISTNDKSIEQLNEYQITNLLMECLFFKFNEIRNIEQEEIDKYFTLL